MEPHDTHFVPLAAGSPIAPEPYLSCIVEPGAVRLVVRPSWMMVALTAFGMVTALALGTAGVLFDVGPGRIMGAIFLAGSILAAPGVRDQHAQFRSLSGLGTLAWLELREPGRAMVHAGDQKIPLEEVEAIEYLRLSYAYAGVRWLPRRIAQVRLVLRNRSNAEPVLLVAATEPDVLQRTPGPAMRQFAAQMRKPLTVITPGTTPVDPGIIFADDTQTMHPAAT